MFSLIGSSVLSFHALSPFLLRYRTELEAVNPWLVHGSVDATQDSLAELSIAALFSALLARPLARVRMSVPREPRVIIIDAIEESMGQGVGQSPHTGHTGSNSGGDGDGGGDGGDSGRGGRCAGGAMSVCDLICAHFPSLPSWLSVVVTCRAAGGGRGARNTGRERFGSGEGDDATIRAVVGGGVVEGLIPETKVGLCHQCVKQTTCYHDISEAHDADGDGKLDENEQGGYYCEPCWEGVYGSPPKKHPPRYKPTMCHACKAHATCYQDANEAYDADGDGKLDDDEKGGYYCEKCWVEVYGAPPEPGGEAAPIEAADAPPPPVLEALETRLKGAFGGRSAVVHWKLNGTKPSSFNMLLFKSSCVARATYMCNAEKRHVSPCPRAR